MNSALVDASARVRAALLDPETLIRAVASGSAPGATPRWRRVEARYIDLSAGRQLQVTSYDDTQAFTANYADASAAVDALLEESFGNWHVESTTGTLQVRVNRKGKVLAQTGPPPGRTTDRAHDRAKSRHLGADAPVFRELGLADENGRIKPSKQAKYRQVDEFLRALDAALDDAQGSGSLRRPTAADPWRVVDLGCGNAYLTFAAQAWLEERGTPAHFMGVDVKQQSREHNMTVASRLGVSDSMDFVVGSIGEAVVGPAPEVVLALHACDTATDEALARAVEWDSPVVLAAPCCHHDIAKQLKKVGAPAPYEAVVRDGILRERLADTLTDALRALLLRSRGYRVDVVEFIDSAHTPRNTLIRAIRTRQKSGASEYAALVEQWKLNPKLAQLLGS